MDTIYIRQYNQSHIHVTGSDNGLENELSEFFKFRVNGYQYMPAYKRGVWDGFIRLFDQRTKLIYAGLFNNIIEFCKKRNYQCDHDIEINQSILSKEDVNNFVKTLQLPFEPRDYQINTFIDCVKNNRALVVSPTGSGKSLMIYLLTRYYNKKTLIITPTTGLVHQMASDFVSYGYDQEIHKIYSGKDKETDCLISCTTWQSIFRMPRDWYDQFDCVICDEAHLAKASSITKIMTNMVNCKYRFGFTGSLDGSQVSALVLTGLFGQIKHVTTTAELIEQKHLSDFKIKCLMLHYPEEIRNSIKSCDYSQELDYIVTNQLRNAFINKLATNISGNSLILFQFVEKHGKVLYELIKSSTNRPVYFIHGGIDGEERNNLRSVIETQNDAIIVASVQVFSTGINIKNLHNIIFASPSKSRVRTLQSIGRVLRKSDSKTNAILYDIVDNFSIKKKYNYTLIHFFERLKIYQQEQFSYKVHNVELK